MLGSILGLFSAAAFGANAIITRRGMLRVSSHFIATITILTGPVFFFMVAWITRDLFKLGQFPWQAYVFFALAGICHFALGRTWAYRSIQLIGANRSNIVTGLNPIVTIALAMTILKESMTLLMAIGMICTLTGPILILLKEQVVPNTHPLKAAVPGKDLDHSTLYRGVLYGIGSAVFWGSSAIFIKLGLEAGGTPINGSLIAYSAASLTILPSALFNKIHREEIIHGDKISYKIALLSGLTTNIAQLLRFLALGVGSVIVISLVQRTVPLWVVLFGFIFNREYESFSRWVLLGNGLLVAGTVLILVSS
jgi:drug/metabolite transporter (DMT)-like permease